MVPLNYNFMWIRVATQDISCVKSQSFAMEAKISVRQVMEFLLDETCNFHETQDVTLDLYT